MTLQIEGVFEEKKPFESKTGREDYELTYHKGPHQMQNFLHKEKVNFFVLRGVIEIYANSFPYGLRMIPRNTLSGPQPDSALYYPILFLFCLLIVYVDHTYGKH